MLIVLVLISIFKQHIAAVILNIQHDKQEVGVDHCHLLFYI